MILLAAMDLQYIVLLMEAVAFCGIAYLLFMWLFGYYTERPSMTLVGMVIGTVTGALTYLQFGFEFMPLIWLMGFALLGAAIGIIMSSVMVSAFGIIIAMGLGIWISTLILGISTAGPMHLTLESSFALLVKYVRISLDEGKIGQLFIEDLDATIYGIIDVWIAWLKGMEAMELLIIAVFVIFMIWIMIFLLMNYYPVASSITITLTAMLIMLWLWDMYVDHFAFHLAQYSARSAHHLLPWVFIMTAIGLLPEFLIRMFEKKQEPHNEAREFMKEQPQYAGISQIFKRQRGSQTSGSK